MHSEYQDDYQRVTNQIIEAMEKGAGDWKMPWHQTAGETFVPINAQSKKPYRGINILSLWAAAEECGNNTNLWATYKQWQELGANVRKAEKATLVVFWKFSDLGINEGSKKEEREEESRRSVLARGYSIFNADQVDGFTPPEVPAIPEVERVQTAENFFSALGADIHHGGNRACYSPGTDHIQMPPFEVFLSALAYYSTLAHESTHWTGAVSRLNRELSTRFGGEAYAAEEQRSGAIPGTFVVNLGCDDAVGLAHGEDGASGLLFRGCRRSDGRFWRRTTSHSVEIKQKNTQQLLGVVVLVQDQLIISANMMVRELPPSAFAGCEELHNHFRQTWHDPAWHSRSLREMPYSFWGNAVVSWEVGAAAA